MGKSTEYGQSLIGRHEVPYPFVENWFYPAREIGIKELGWRPGTIGRMVENDYGARTYRIAKAMGLMVLTVVDVHRLPNPYPARVFYIRQWRNPGSDKPYGKQHLRITTLSAFRRLLRGYRHPFDLSEEACEELKDNG